jgi:hypothetical protein
MSALCQKRTSAESFDHLVGPRQKGFRDRQSERLCRLEIDGQLEFHRQSSERVPSGTIGELQVAEIGSKSQTDP